MSNLEHLIENGLCRLEEGKSYREWREAMQEDCNWEGNENITIDNLWEICQYVIYTWDLEKSLKEQEAVEPISYMDGIIQRFTCGKCGKHLLYAKWGRDNYCSKCGQEVKWND